MNKRIEQLIKQAYVDADHGAGSYFDKEKFAELIVRECCDMVNKHTQHNNPYDCPLVLDIKEYFGVE